MKKNILILLVVLPCLCFGQRGDIGNIEVSERMKTLSVKEMLSKTHKKSLEGKVSGVLKTALKASDTEEFYINCRCPSSFLNDYSALIVLNGIPIKKGVLFLDEINPDDIKTFSVLKDNDAIEKYGDLGKNGVVELETEPMQKYDLMIAEKGMPEFLKEEYEVLVFAPGYEAFLATQKPKEFYTESFLKAKNKLMVAEWNYRYRSPGRYNADIYEESIDYDSKTDYGVDVEYQLYMFFRFMEKEHNISSVIGWLIVGLYLTPNLL